VYCRRKNRWNNVGQVEGTLNWVVKKGLCQVVLSEYLMDKKEPASHLTTGGEGGRMEEIAPSREY
jgi:hypothetical protein